jgi:hypothetical protein
MQTAVSLSFSWPSALIGFQHSFLVALFIVITKNSNDPVKFCSGDNEEEITDEHRNERRHQALDSQAQSSLGHGHHSGQDYSFSGQPNI